MPGENCCIPLCTNSRRKKGLSFFKLPSEKKENRRAWRKRWLDQILKYREMDSQFKNHRPPTCPKILNCPKFCMFYFFVLICPTLDWKVLICPNFSCLGKLKALFLLYMVYSFVHYMHLKNKNSLNNNLE